MKYITLLFLMFLWGCDTPPRMASFSIQKEYRITQTSESTTNTCREKVERILSQTADQYSLVKSKPSEYSKAFVIYQENTKYNPLSIEAYEDEHDIVVDLGDFNAGAFPSHKLFDAVVENLQIELESEFGKTNVTPTSGWTLPGTTPVD